MNRTEEKLIAVLASGTTAEKQEACRELWRIGTDASVPALEKMLAGPDVHMVEAACYALCRRRSQAVSRALRRTLDRAPVAGLEAIVNLVGERREAWAAQKLAQMVPESKAAVAALGKLATPEAVRVLLRLRTSGNAAAEHALLQSAQELARKGQTAAAKEIYRELTGSRTTHIGRGARLALETMS